jgi:hypothetical protein
VIKKMFAVVAVTAVVGLGTALPAFAASSQTTFGGQSAQGADVRYFAMGQPDGSGTGTFFYSGTLTLQCEGFNRYIATHTNNPKPDGYPKSIANSTQCFGGDTRYYAHIESIDRIGIGQGAHPSGGEVKDGICITIKLFPARDNPDPVIKDCGAPLSGDVVITPV